MKRLLQIVALMVMPIMVFAASAGGEDEPMESTMKVFVVIPQEDGSEKLMGKEHADSGQILEYHLLYTNEQRQPVRFKRVETLVPKGTEYIPGSASADVNTLFQVSIDGGRTYEAEPVKRKENGVEFVVHEAAYTHLLWTNQQVIRPRQNWIYKFRVKVK